TLTKDCPWNVPVACVTIMGQRICKKCY
ncbi:Columbicin A-like bacteriocin peptide, partial [Bacillus cereus]